MRGCGFVVRTLGIVTTVAGKWVVVVMVLVIVVGMAVVISSEARRRVLLACHLAV